MKKRLLIGAGVALSSLAVTGTADAFDFDWGSASFAFNNHVSEGAAWRLERPDSSLIGKLDIDGQQNLCATDACMSFSATADPAPNARLVRAAGSFSANNGDQGDLNFQQYDVVAGATKLDSSLTSKWRDFSLKVSGTGLFDPVNANLVDTNPNTTYQPAQSDAPAQSRRLTGRTIFLRDAVVTYSTTLLDRNVSLSAGQQNVHWGESAYIAVNSLGELNPPDERLYHMPGVRFSEIFQPVPLLKFNTDLFEGASLEALYQLKSRPVVLDQSSTFYSDRNVTDSGTPIDITLSQIPIDPNQVGTIPGLASLISSTSTTVKIGSPRNASDWGQYGAHLTYFFSDIGTEFALYYMRYNARLPNFSILASKQSCINGTTTGGAPGDTNIITAANACDGFDGTLSPLLNKIFPGPPKEPLPIDTVQPFFEYPSGIHLYGFSFNTNVFGWAFAGEYSYRPNVPLQVDLTDVLYTAVQPAFPAKAIELGPLGSIPSAASYFPSFLMKYRDEFVYPTTDNPSGVATITPGQYIPGFERREVGQLDITALKAISNNNWFHADQIIFVTEVGAQTIYNIPNKDQLQFETGDPNDTHASPGADGTGGTGNNPDGSPYTTRYNPTLQTTGFASRWSWGVREQARFEYDNLFRGITYKPSILVARDFSGYGALPVQDFVAGRWQLTADNLFNITPAWSFQLIYQMDTGGKPVNTQYDRDTIGAVIAYDF